MSDLLSKDRGQLKAHIKVSGKGREEHFRFSGNMMLWYAVELMSHWIISHEERSAIEPTGDLLTMQLHKGEYWFSSDYSKVSKDALDDICGDLEEFTDDSRKLIRWSDEVRIFNPTREEGWERPLIRIKRRSGADEMLFLDCSLKELAGLIYAVKNLNLVRCGFDLYSQRFFSTVPLKKAVPVEKKKKDTAPSNAASGPSLTTDAELYRKLQNFHLQALL